MQKQLCVQVEVGVQRRRVELGVRVEDGVQRRRVDLGVEVGRDVELGRRAELGRDVNKQLIRFRLFSWLFRVQLSARRALSRDRGYRRNRCRRCFSFWSSPGPMQRRF